MINIPFKTFYGLKAEFKTIHTDPGQLKFKKRWLI